MEESLAGEVSVERRHRCEQAANPAGGAMLIRIDTRLKRSRRTSTQRCKNISGNVAVLKWNVSGLFERPRALSIDLSGILPAHGEFTEFHQKRALARTHSQKFPLG